MRVSTVLAGVAQRGLLFLLLVQLGAMSLAWSIVAWLLYPILPKPRATVLGRTAIAWMYRTFWATAGACGMLKIDAAALDRLRDEPGGLIIAANHPTMLDALVVIARLPRGVCIMKAELMRNPFLGAGARLARYIRNDSSRGMVRCAVECLREGGQLVMFPEGTRTVEQPLNPFRPGISLIAQLAQVPIQTVIIDTETAYLRKGWPIWRAPPVFPVRIRARLGARFAADADHRALVRKLECYFVRELAGTETEREAA